MKDTSKGQDCHKGRAPKITHTFCSTSILKKPFPHNASVMRSPLVNEAILTIALRALKLTHMQGSAIS